MSDCPDPDTMMAFLEGALSAAQVRAIDRHIDTCPACCELVAGMAGDSDASRDQSQAPLTLPPTDPESRWTSGALAGLSQPMTAEQAALRWSFAPGTQINHYRLMRPLGRGGMGEVYLARDTTLGRKVALKFINPDRFESAKAVERFLFEAQTTARFSHPNIVTIHGVGDFRGRPYVALEYLEGRSLAERIAHDPPSAREAVRIGLVLAEALQEAHRQRILHLDLKPSNVMLARDGRVIVLDFGLAQLHRTLATGTQTAPPPTEPSFPMITPEAESGRIGGTPRYMSPEQWTGETCTAATDVWGIGLILFEVAHGRHPFEGLDLRQLMAAVTHTKQPPALQAKTPEVADLSRIIARCLARDPKRRPRTAEIADIFRQLLRASPEPRPSLNPFRGLLPFDESHSRYFFGRGDEIAAFLERLRRQPVAAVVGPSGAGKSSFVHAGVIPRLKEQGNWEIIDLRPGRRPFERLARELLRHQERFIRSEELDQREHAALVDRLVANPRQLALSLYRLCEQRAGHVLLFVDQMEELYTLAEPEFRQPFAEAVCLASDDLQDPMRVVLTIRDDFLFRLADTAAAHDAASRITVLRPPGPEALREALLGPVEAVGHGYEDPRMVDEMVAEVEGVASCLPLLQFAGQTLWERRDRARRMLCRATYEQTGGVAGALARHADGVLASLSADERRLARTIFLRLVTAEGTRRVLPRAKVLDELGEAAEPVLARLTDARLITAGQAEQDGEAKLELVHESLLAHWQQLRRWIEESNEQLVFVAELDQAAELWEKRGEPADEVWRGDALREACRAVQRCSSEIVPRRARRFLEAGVARQWRERRNRRLRLMFGFSALALLAVGAVIVAVVMSYQNREMERRRAQALRESARGALIRGDRLEARAKLRLALEAQDSAPARVMWWRLSRDPLLWSAPLGALAYGVDFSPDGRTLAACGADRAIHLFDTRTRRLRRTLRGHRDDVLQAVFSRDGRMIASGSWDGELRLWDVKTGEALLVKRVERGSLGALRFSPDGRFLAGGARSGTIRLWSAGGKLQQTLRGHRGSVNGLIFSPDSQTLISSGADSTIRVWNVATGVQRRLLRGHGGAVHGLALAAGGKLISGSRDRTVRIWDLEGGKLVRTLPGHGSTIWGVASSPRGDLIAYGGADSQIRLWDTSTGTHRGTLSGHAATIWGLTFSPDGRILASSSADKTVRLWDIERVPRRERWSRGHVGGSSDVCFSPDGRVLASGGEDGAVLLWDVATGRERQTLLGHKATVWEIEISPDGKTLASSSTDETVRLWDLATGSEKKVLSGHGAPVYGIAFSPDGALLASGGVDRKIRLWQVSDGAPLRALVGHAGSVVGVAFAPNGRLLASASTDGTVRLWDATSGEQVMTLRGHRGHVYDVVFSPDGQHLASGGADETVRIWQLSTGESQVIGKLATSRLYTLSFSPDGRMLAAPGADHTARIWRLSPGGQPVDAEPIVLRGHWAKVTSARFDPRGEQLATASLDGTVRLWRVATGGPVWRAPILLSTARGPVELATHLGWQRVDQARPDAAETAKPRPGPSPRWRRAITERARRAVASSDGQLVCLQTDDHHLQVWDRITDGLVGESEGGAIEQLVALESGCAARTVDGDVVLLGRSSPPRRIADGAIALAWDGRALLVAIERRVLLFDGAGKRQATSYPTDPFVTALARDQRWLYLGHRDGSVELVAVESGRRRGQFSFEETPSSPVTRLIPGPRGTLLAGFACGSIGLWDIETGHTLARERLHGPVVHLLSRADRLYAGTDVGQHLVWDLRVLHAGYCDLMKQVWRAVDVVWRDGLITLQPPPENHPCR